jgi:hypothetical protein
MVALFRVAGYRGSLRERRRPIIRSTRTPRIIQLNGLDISTGSSISPLHASHSAQTEAPIFMRFRELWHEEPIRRFH